LLIIKIFGDQLEINMIRKLIGVVVATILLTLHMVVSSATALELDEATRTVPLNDQGYTVVLSKRQVKEGKRLFNYACNQCHAGGVTKSNPNVGLGPEALAGAVPNRNNLEGLVDYLRIPTTYDGKRYIVELHPSTASADIFAEMRNLTDEDLVAIAGHILLQPKIMGNQWDGVKID
jgi:photosystem II cytochrome c550